MKAAPWLSLIRPGHLVAVAQAVGEPTPLLEQLRATAPADVEVFVGPTHSDARTRPSPLVSLGALGLSLTATGSGEAMKGPEPGAGAKPAADMAESAERRTS